MSAKEKFCKKGFEKVECKECGGFYHSLAPHLGKKHGISVDEYVAKHRDPDTGVAPLTISEYASKQIDRGRKKGAAPLPTAKAASPTTTAPTAPATPPPPAGAVLDFGGWELGIRDDATLDGFRDHVPAHDPNWEPDDDILVRLAEHVALNEVALLVGPTGCGKSSTVAELAALLNRPMVRIQCDATTSYSYLFGKTIVKKDDSTGQAVTAIKKGIIPRFGEAGAFIVLDEADALDPDVRIALHEVLERDAAGRRKCTIEADDQDDTAAAQVIWFHPDARIFLTGNNMGSDIAGNYGGTDSAPNLAFLYRCERLNVSYPDRATLTRILQKKSGGLPKNTAKLIADAVHEVLVSHTTADLPWCFSVRRAITLATKMKLYSERGISPAVAVERTVLDNVHLPEPRDDVKEILQRVGLPVTK